MKNNSRILFKEDIIVECTLTSGKSIESEHYGEMNYRYGYLPDNSHTVFSKTNVDNVFVALCNMFDIPFFSENNHPKRKYIYLDCYLNQKVYEDELVSFSVTKQYAVLTDESINFLQEHLTFDDYTQLIFDRENELRLGATV